MAVVLPLLPLVLVAGALVFVTGVHRRRAKFFVFIKFLSPTSHRDENLTAGGSDHHGNHSGKSFSLKLFRRGW